MPPDQMPAEWWRDDGLPDPGTPRLLLDCHAAIAESPTWSADERALYWIDVKKPALQRLGADGSRRTWHLGSDVGAFALTADKQGAVVCLRTGIFLLSLGTGELALLAGPPFDPGLFRFNEGICDPAGRFWTGVMYDPMPNRSAPGATAAMHVFTFAGGLVAGPDRSDLHNGFAWTADGRHFFWSHSYAGAVFRAEYDPAAGLIGPASRFLDVHVPGALPDGAAVDEQGCYWCAVHGAGLLHRYDPSGALVGSISLPVSQPTMCCFAGPNLDELVITSASHGLSAAELREQPHAGALLRLRPGVRGLARPCVVR